MPPAKKAISKKTVSKAKNIKKTRSPKSKIAVVTEAPQTTGAQAQQTPTLPQVQTTSVTGESIGQTSQVNAAAPVPQAVEAAASVFPSTTVPAQVATTAPDTSATVTTSSPSNDISKYTVGVSSTTGDIPLERSNKRVYFITFGILILVFASVAAGFYLRVMTEDQQEGVKSSDNTQVAQEEEQTEEIQLSTSPQTSLERKDITLEILNGSGIAGAAKTRADRFEELGYKIGEVGNNPYEAKTHYLYVKKEIKDQVEVLLADVKKELNITTISGDVPDDSEYDARIILGRSGNEIQDSDE